MRVSHRYRNGLARQPFVTAATHSRYVNTESKPCPRCGSVAVKRIVWTDDPSKIGTFIDPAVAYLSGSPMWNESSGTDLICSVCEERFWSDPLRKAKDEEDERRQQSRIAAIKSGEYMLFNPRTTSADEVAHAIWLRIQRSNKDRAKAARKPKGDEHKGGDEKDGASREEQRRYHHQAYRREQGK